MVYTTNITRINYLAASKMIAAAVARADEMNVPNVSRSWIHQAALFASPERMVLRT